MPDKSIKTYIDTDIKYNMTPDLSTLRYYGSGIPVFLWDDLQDYQTLSMILGAIDFNNNYESKYFNALSVQKYVPWYNMGDSKETYAAYCLEEYDDLAFLDVPEYTLGIPLQLKGKLALFSVEAMQELDAYYENGRLFTRTKINVYSSHYSKKPMEAYTWFNYVDQISTFDTQTSEYVLDEDIDFTPFNSKKFYTGPEYYEM